jgi:hypothetical protein
VANAEELLGVRRAGQDGSPLLGGCQQNPLSISLCIKVDEPLLEPGEPWVSGSAWCCFNRRYQLHQTCASRDRVGQGRWLRGRRERDLLLNINEKGGRTEVRMIWGVQQGAEGYAKISAAEDREPSPSVAFLTP